MRYFVFDKDSKLHCTNSALGDVDEQVHIWRTMKVVELFFVIEGNLYIEQKDIKYHLKSGDIFIAEPSIPYGGWKESSSKFYWAHFEHDDSAYFCDDDSSDLKYCIPQHFNVPVRDSMSIIFTILTQYSMTNGKCEVTDELLKALLLDINTLAEYQHENTDLQNRNQHFQKVVEYFHISPFLNEVSSVNDMAEYFGYNKNYLIRLFKNNTGMTPLKYFHIKKIEKAQELLLLKNMSIAEVAEALQFNYYYFNKLFKKVTGMTPGEFKKRSVPSVKEYLQYSPVAKIKDEKQ